MKTYHLLPCPMCGGAAPQPKEVCSGGWSVECPCGVELRLQSTPDDCVEIWNRRTTAWPGGDNDIPVQIALVVDSDGGFVAYGDGGRTVKESYAALREEGWLPSDDGDPTFQTQVITLKVVVPMPQKRQIAELSTEIS